MCDEFCEKISKTYEAEFEPITPEEIEKYDKGEESKLDQMMCIIDGREMQLADLWNDWIREELWDSDGEVYEIDRDYTDSEVYYE